METDKATVTYEATDEGYIAKILVGAGEIKVEIVNWYRLVPPPYYFGKTSIVIRLVSR